MKIEELIKVILTPAELEVYNKPPLWEANPPQREEYYSDLAYALGVRKYTQQVLSKQKL